MTRLAVIKGLWVALSGKPRVRAVYATLGDARTRDYGNSRLIGNVYSLIGIQ
jgi:hypothetical protein